MFWELFKSDFYVVYNKLSFNNIVKAIFNPSIHAALLIRIATCFSSKIIYSIVRIVLISKHSIDVANSANIGPRLKLPHPMGIVIGETVVIGSDAVIYHNCTFGNKGGYPTIGDRLCIYCNSVVVGPIHIGDDVIIGANSFVCQSIDDSVTYFKK